MPQRSRCSALSSSTREGKAFGGIVRQCQQRAVVAITPRRAMGSPLLCSA
jgi:hypothetical protein